MKKEELEALGLDRDTIKEIQRIHGIDVQKTVRKVQSRDECRPMREAIAAMLPLLKEPDHLQRVLKLVNSLYYTENRGRKEEAAISVATTNDGKAEQGTEQAYSDCIVPQDLEGVQ